MWRKSQDKSLDILIRKGGLKIQFDHFHHF